MDRKRAAARSGGANKVNVQVLQRSRHGMHVPRSLWVPFCQVKERDEIKLTMDVGGTPVSFRVLGCNKP